MELRIRYEDFINTYPKTYKKALLYPKVLRLRRRGLSFSKIKKLLSSQIPYHPLYRWYNGLSIPLPFKNFSKIKKKFDKKGIEKLATVIGHLLRDGGVDKKKILHYCNIEEFLIKSSKIQLKEFSYKTNV